MGPENEAHVTGMTEADREVYLRLLESMARALKLMEDDKLARSKWADDLKHSIVNAVSSDVVAKISGVGEQLSEIAELLDSGMSVHIRRIDNLETLEPRVTDLERKVDFLMRKVGT
jgi:hypothetical protein